MNPLLGILINMYYIYFMKRLTQKEFLDRVTLIHPTLDFSEFIFNTTRTVSIVIDTLGIKYLFNANHLLNGKKPKSQSAINKQEWFIKNAKSIHGEYYNYSKVEYINMKTKVCIICPKHGEFFTTSVNHLTMKYKCKKCSAPKIINHPGGYNSKYKREPNYSVSLYKIRLYNDNESFYKIGLTNNIKIRMNAFPYKVEIIEVEKGILGSLYLKEQKIIKNLKDFKYTPKIHFGGYSECFSKI